MSKKLVLGKGVYCKGKYKAKEDGKHVRFYSMWWNMLKRCYSEEYQSRFPTYIGCSVDGNWLFFQNFAEWCDGDDYNTLGYQLDKDLLIPNNKIYSPKACCFVPSEINALLTDCRAVRGDLPQGVSFRKDSNKYRACVSVDGRKISLGSYDCPNEAYLVYKKAKEAYVKKKALEWQDRIADNVFQALMNWQLTE